MVFPQSGLPDRVTVRRRTVTGTDDDDNPRYGWTTLVDTRSARFYRDVPKNVPLVREGLTVTAMVAFKALPGDIRLSFKDEVLLFGPEFPEAGMRWLVVWPYAKMLWKSQSHWELALATEAGAREMAG